MGSGFKSSGAIQLYRTGHHFDACTRSEDRNSKHDKWNEGVLSSRYADAELFFVGAGTNPFFFVVISWPMHFLTGYDDNFVRVTCTSPPNIHT